MRLTRLSQLNDTLCRTYPCTVATAKLAQKSGLCNVDTLEFARYSVLVATEREYARERILRTGVRRG